LSEWGEVSLGDVVSSLGGLWGEDEPGDGLVEVLALRGTDFERARRLDLDGVPKRFEREDIVAGRLLAPGSMVLEASGGSKDRPVGRCLFVTKGLADSADCNLAAASFCKILRVDSTVADPRFVYAVLKNLYESGGIERFQVQSTGLRNLRTTQLLADFRFRVPSLEAQKRIGAVVGAFDELDELNERRIRRLHDLARSIYRGWFERSRPTGSWCALSDVADVNRSTAKKNELPDPIEYLDISSLGTGRLKGTRTMPSAEAPGRARRRLGDGDVVWSTVRPNRRAHGLVHGPPSNLIGSTGLAVLSPRDVPSSFLFEYASSEEFGNYLVTRATGSAYPAVRAKDFEEAPVFVPEQAVLRQFDQAVDPMLRLASLLQRQSAKRDAVRSLLLPRLVTGRLDISDLDLGALTPVEPG
jgi:type I restriction enzyme, S subunit